MFVNKNAKNANIRDDTIVAFLEFMMAFFEIRVAFFGIFWAYACHLLSLTSWQPCPKQTIMSFFKIIPPRGIQKMYF